MASSLPVVHVAMATYNGQPWIAEQVETVLNQQGVQVKLVISDDGSTDGTAQWLQDLAKNEPRVTLLPPRAGEASVAGNFLYALASLDLGPGDYAAFADQDDLWRPHKLRDQIRFLRQRNANAVSANVTAFEVGPSGKTSHTLIRKDQDQVGWDFLFEAPGPGSTYVFDYRAWRTLIRYLRRWGADGVAVHDWFAYAVLRAAGLTWAIQAEPQVAYRQHQSNVAGAHQGLGAFTDRFKLLRSGHYRAQFLLMTRVAQRAGEDAGREDEFFGELVAWRRRLEDKSIRGRADVARNAGSMRRRRLDQVTLAAACLLGVW